MIITQYVCKVGTYVIIVPITHAEVSIQLDSRSSSREYTDIMILLLYIDILWCHVTG